MKPWHEIRDGQEEMTGNNRPFFFFFFFGENNGNVKAIRRRKKKNIRNLKQKEKKIIGKNLSKKANTSYLKSVWINETVASGRDTALGSGPRQFVQ